MAAVAIAATGCGDDSRPPAAAVRSDEACARPYSRSSPWNTPIGSRPAYHARSDFHVGAMEGELTSDPTQYTYPVYEVTRDTPLQAVQVGGIYSEVIDDEVIELRKGVIRLPIPDDAEPAAGSDRQIILVNHETGDEWGVWRLRHESDGWHVTNGSRYNMRWDGVPPASQGDPFASRGAGVPYQAGLVRPCEISRGRIEHALAFAYNFPTADHVYPATKSDGTSQDPRDMPEGSRLQLDPSIPDREVRAWGCTGPCLTVANALQEYGMYVIDNSGRPKVMFEYEETAGWNGTVTADTVSPIPLSAFKLLRSDADSGGG
jgi:hypothetical protein